MGGNDKPIVALSVNLDEIMLEAVGLLRSARTEFETVTSAINERMNVSMDSTMDDVVAIVTNVRQITDNLAQTTGTFYQPIFFLVLMFIFVLIFIVILLLFALRTRREYKKRPIKLFFRRRFGKNAAGRVEPRVRRSTSALTVEEGGTLEATGDPKYPKKGNDTLV